MWHQREGEKESGPVASEKIRSGDSSSYVPTLNQQLWADLTRESFVSSANCLCPEIFRVVCEQQSFLPSWRASCVLFVVTVSVTQVTAQEQQASLMCLMSNLFLKSRVIHCWCQPRSLPQSTLVTQLLLWWERSGYALFALSEIYSVTHAAFCRQLSCTIFGTKTSWSNWCCVRPYLFFL